MSTSEMIEMVKRSKAFKEDWQRRQNEFSWDTCGILAMWVTLAAAVAVKYL